MLRSLLNNKIYTYLFNGIFVFYENGFYKFIKKKEKFSRTGGGFS